jgi:hypothetical protein
VPLAASLVLSTRIALKTLDASQYESSRSTGRTNQITFAPRPVQPHLSETGFDCPALALLDTGAELRYRCVPINRRTFQSRIASVSHENPITYALL